MAPSLFEAAKHPEKYSQFSQLRPKQREESRKLFDYVKRTGNAQYNLTLRKYARWFRYNPMTMVNYGVACGLTLLYMAYPYNLIKYIPGWLTDTDRANMEMNRKLYRIFLDREY
ncbi:MAG: hypothetical protein MHMPM18_000660 [Marteilia pararefringens]